MNRSVALPFVALSLVAGVALATFVVSQVTVDLTVEEAFTIEPTTFVVDMKPGEEEAMLFEVCNGSTSDLDISFVGSVTPAETGVTITLPATDDIEGGECETFGIVAHASGDAVPQLYSIVVDVGRE